MADIIEKAEKKNRRMKIGGALWFDPETNVVHQVLEGEERAVTRLLDVIAQDKRHKAIVMENMEIVHERRFQDWGGMALTESPLLKKKARKGAVGYRMHDDWEEETKVGS
eukprot:CAMPEP_0184502984 /NCGR_PEP_ID=MMETSP0113_2-20130426/51608_1 /TAXON_ID=91329 /ORGANISM="Norrisiella sphaerica, Strain BC52" /LENGTH=109 /DNA_ID=CAMNT_0026892369 /DNA_START=197 /DNA_END=526 /DNA_ORIENTATION=+